MLSVNNFGRNLNHQKDTVFPEVFYDKKTAHSRISKRHVSLNTYLIRIVLPRLSLLYDVISLQEGTPLFKGDQQCPPVKIPPIAATLAKMA